MLEQILDFEFGALPTVHHRGGASERVPLVSLVGAQSSPGASLRLPGGAESFAIFLQPAALRQLLGVPSQHLVDRSFHARDVMGGHVELLWSAMAGARTFEERVRLAECFLLRLPRLAEPTPVARGAMAAFRGRGCVSVAEMAESASLSVRQLERRYERELGMPPKLFLRIARFESALDAKVTTPARTWLDVAHTAGYFDQMHLVRDFKSLGGTTPDCLIAQLGDTRPPALADAD